MDVPYLIFNSDETSSLTNYRLQPFLIFWRNHYWYQNKHYYIWKPWILVSRYWNNKVMALSWKSFWTFNFVFKDTLCLRGYSNSKLFSLDKTWKDRTRKMRMLLWKETYHIVIVDMQDFLAASTPFFALSKF